MSKHSDRYERLARHGIETTEHGTLEDLSWDEHRNGALSQEDKEFIGKLADLLWSWDQARQCPCSDCVGNFIVRSRRFRRSL